MPKQIDDYATDLARAEKALERANAKAKTAAEDAAAALKAVDDARQAYNSYVADCLRSARATAGVTA